VTVVVEVADLLALLGELRQKLDLTPGAP